MKPPEQATAQQQVQFVYAILEKVRAHMGRLQRVDSLLKLGRVREAEELTTESMEWLLEPGTLAILLSAAATGLAFMLPDGERLQLHDWFRRLRGEANGA